MPEFKYAIGQTLALKEAVAQMSRESLAPMRLTVLSRILEECHGGVQIIYIVRVVSTGYGGGVFDANPQRLYEFELVPYPDLPEKNGETPLDPVQALEHATKQLERWTTRVEVAKKKVEGGTA